MTHAVSSTSNMEVDNQPIPKGNKKKRKSDEISKDTEKKVHALAIRKLNTETVFKLLPKSCNKSLPDKLLEGIKEITKKRNPSAKGFKRLMNEDNQPFTWKPENHHGFKIAIYTKTRGSDSDLTKKLRTMRAKIIATEKKPIYLIFLYRVIAGLGEIFSLSTDSSHFVTRNFVDYTFAFKIARRILDPKLNNIKTYSFVGERGTDEEKKIIPKLYFLDYFLYRKVEILKGRLRPESSVSGLPCINKGNANPILDVTSGRLRFETKIDFEDYSELVDHLSWIFRGKKTFNSKTKEPEQDQEEFKFLDFIQVIPNHKKEKARFDKDLIEDFADFFLSQNNAEIYFRIPRGDGYTEYRGKPTMTFKVVSNNKDETIELHEDPKTAEVIEKLKFAFVGFDIKQMDIHDIRRVIKFARISVLRTSGKRENLKLVDCLEGNILVKEEDETTNSYRKIEKVWHLLNRDFLDVLNYCLVDMLNENLFTDRTAPWFPALLWPSHSEEMVRKKEEKKKKGKYKVESEYNRTYFLRHQKEKSSEGIWLVGDEVKIPGEIELFDLIYMNKDTVYLYHVKKGTIGIRTVVSQLRIAAETIRNYLRGKKRNGDNPLVAWFKAAKRKGENREEQDICRHYAEQLNVFTDAEAFAEQIRTKKIVFCLGYVDDRKPERMLEDYIKARVVTNEDMNQIFPEESSVRYHNLLKSIGIINRHNCVDPFSFPKNDQALDQLLKEKNVTIRKDKLQKIYQILEKKKNSKLFKTDIPVSEILRLENTLRSLGYEFAIYQINRKQELEDSSSIPHSPGEVSSTVHVHHNDEGADLEQPIITERSVLNLRNIGRFRVMHTEKDGACGLHALLGSLDHDQFIYHPDHDEMGELDYSPKMEFGAMLKQKVQENPDGKIAEFFVDYIKFGLIRTSSEDDPYFKMLFEPQEFSDKYVDWQKELVEWHEEIKNLQDEVIKGKKQIMKMEVIQLKNFFREEFEKEEDNVLKEDIETFRSDEKFLQTNPRRRRVLMEDDSDYAYEVTKKYLNIYRDKDKDVTFFDKYYERMKNNEGMNEIPPFRPLVEDIEELKTLKKEEGEFCKQFTQDEFLSNYNQQMQKSSYYLSDDELQLAALIYNKKLCLVAPSNKNPDDDLYDPREINLGGEDQIVIASDGRNRHYMRCIAV